jgi:hypothetical protein
VSKQTIAEAPGVELFLRDIPETYTFHGLATEQYELEIGGWVYDSRYATRAGMEEMIEVIDELHTSLDVARAALFAAWQGGTTS